MQAVTPDNVCNIIILLTVCQFHSLYFLSIPFPVFSHFFDRVFFVYTLYIPINFISVFYEVHIQVENILYYI